MQSLHSSAKCWVRIVCHSGAKTSSDRSRKELLTIPQMAAITKRSDYVFWRLLYRCRQWFWLLVQGDFPYMMSRAFARVRPNAFDQR